jgi:hypothetical protein
MSFTEEHVCSEWAVGEQDAVSSAEAYRLLAGVSTDADTFGHIGLGQVTGLVRELAAGAEHWVEPNRADRARPADRGGGDMLQLHGDTWWPWE